MSVSLRGLLPLLASLLLMTCTKPDNIGLDILPESDQIGVFTTDTFTLKSYTVLVDSLIGSGTTRSLLGSYGDPVFGSSTAEHYAQFRLSNPNVDFGGVLNCDSIVLGIEIDAFYGNKNTLQTISVYELDEELSTDTVYYTNRSFSASTLRGRQTISINPDDSVFYGDTKFAPYIRLKLDNSFGDYLMSLPAAAYTSSDEFLKEMRGLFVSADRIKNHNEGGIAVLNYSTGVSRLRLYYSDSLFYDFSVSSASARHSIFEHNYSPVTEVGMQLQNPALGQQKVYVQSMAGLKTNIFIPYLSSLKALGPISINQAEVILPIESGSDVTYAPNERLVLIASDSVGTEVTIPDLLEPTSYYGGIYDEVNKEYRFNIARHIQQILSGSREDFGLVLVASGAVVNPNRTVLKGADPVSGGGMKLKLIYSLVD